MDAMEPTIICPNCDTEIKLTESLAAPLVASTRKHYEQQIAQQDKDIATREKSVRDKEKQLADEKKVVDERIAEEVGNKLKAERAAIVSAEAKKAKLAASAELEEKVREIADIQDVLKQREGKLAEAQKAQADFLKKQRALEDKERELELTVEKRIQAGVGVARDKAKGEIVEEFKLKFAEKDKTISGLQTQLQDALRKAEQGSQQLQGEVQELELEEMLRTKFPTDVIEPVPKGEHGGDAIQRVMGPLGQVCGTILWESKRTKGWTAGWLPKLRDDQRSAKAEIAVLISQALPKDVETFDMVDNVWVAHPHVAMPVAIMLRHSLIEVSSARVATEGQQSKMEMLYTYLTGSGFRHRIQAIVEGFTAMKGDLDREKKVITKQWAKREKQTERVMEATVGMYGDLQGIAGKGLPEIEMLEVEALESPKESQIEDEEE